MTEIVGQQIDEWSIVRALLSGNIKYSPLNYTLWWKRRRKNTCRRSGRGHVNAMKRVYEQGEQEALLPWPSPQGEFLEGTWHQSYR